MARLSPILRSVAGNRLAFWCPGCDEMHAVIVRTGDEHPSWKWNGLVLKPTFEPSIRVSHGPNYKPGPGDPPAVCHSWVKSGRIEFCDDSTHSLVGQTVDLPAWTFPYGGTED